MKRHVLIPILALWVIQIHSYAQDFWQYSGVFGGNITAFGKASDGTIYAGTQDNGIFASTDDGQSWQVTGLSDQTITALEVIPNGNLYVCVHIVNSDLESVSNVLRSTDNGASWQTLLSSPDSVEVLAVNAYGVICLGIDTPTPVLTSTDNGNSWIDVQIKLSDLDIEHIVDIEVDESGIFYAPVLSTVFTSSDGLAWEAHPVEITGSSLPINNIEVLADKALLAVVGLSGRHEVFQLQENDDVWQEVFSTEPGNPIIDIAEGNSEIYCITEFRDIYTSVDNGGSWSKVGAIEDEAQNLIVTDQNDILAGVADRGIWRSSDGGTSFQSSSTGLLAANIITVHATSDGAILAGGDRGNFYRSTDNGNSWRNTKIRTSLSIWRLESSPDGSIYYAVASNARGVGSEGIYRSEDFGITWTRMNGIGGVFQDVRAFRQHSNGALYAGVIGSVSGVFTYDAGQDDWRMIGAEDENIWSLHIDDNGAIFAGAEEGRVFRSEDDGMSWSRTVLEDASSDVQAFAEHDGSIFAATFTDGVYRTDDNGDTWRRVATEPELISGIAVNRVGDLFASTLTQGCFRSNDGGVTWEDVSGGLIHPGVFSVEISSQDFIFAGVPRGVAKSVQGTTNVESRTRKTGTADVLSIIGAHPVVRRTRLKYMPSAAGDLKVSIYNRLGAQISVLFEGAISGGPMTFLWDTSGFSQGVYFCRAIRADQMTVVPIIVQ